ncbi:hypothetical protein ACH4CE_03910 [Streptomyces gelaticus]|uniref:hypothetical protein n=1 Tax=Streptomyces gelaticus TaxID=285446 RepID=UPI0037AFE2F0
MEKLRSGDRTALTARYVLDATDRWRGSARWWSGTPRDSLYTLDTLLNVWPVTLAASA